MSTKLKIKKGAKIEYGNVGVDDVDFSPAATRRRISIMIPEDVLIKLRAKAADEGTGYQTLINTILRDAAMHGDSLAKRIDRLETSLEPISKLFAVLSQHGEQAGEVAEQIKPASVILSDVLARHVVTATSHHPESAPPSPTPARSTPSHKRRTGA